MLRSLPFPFLALMAMLMLAATGCSSSDDDDGGSNNSSGSGYGTVVFQNSSSYDIWWIYLSPSSDSTWGSDRLGSDILYSGQTFTITNVPAGIYDAMAEPLSLPAVYAWGFTVPSGGTYTLQITNSSWSLIDNAAAADGAYAVLESGPIEDLITL